MDRLRNNGGQALVEFALVSVVLMVFVVGVAEFARAWYYDNALENAVRAGVRYATELPNDASFQSNVATYVQNQMTSAVPVGGAYGVTLNTPTITINSTTPPPTVTVIESCVFSDPVLEAFSYMVSVFFSKTIPASLTLSRSGTMYYSGT